MLKKIFIFLLFCCTASLVAQKNDTNVNVSGSLSVSKRMMEVEKSLIENESDEALAQNYEKLAKELVVKGEYAKAEEYLNKAKALYQRNNNKEKIAAIEREVAKIKEAQNKISEAIVGYSNASQISENSIQQSLNTNDVQRLMNQSSPKKQAKYIQKNIELLDNAKSKDVAADVAKEEKSVAYRQLADVNIKMDFKEEAIKNLNSALEMSNPRAPEEAIKINRDIAKIFSDSKDYEKVIDISKELVEEARKTQNPKVEIEQLQSLSSAYFESDNKQKGLESLREAYNLAVEKGHTLDAKSSLVMLVKQYTKEKQPQKALDAYADFVSKLEPLIKSDSTLLDEKIFVAHEERITQLEKERELKDELIQQSSIFNYILSILIVIILVFFGFIIKSFFSIKRKNKRIALQALRREMNPHFIFNSLNSVNQFIAQNNELEANKYLSSYSKLMRNVMENSNKDFVTLTNEIDQLKEYLELEYMRFHDKFDYQIIVEEEIDTDSTIVPNMLIQPHIENAIWHGLRYKNEKGLLTLSVKQSGNKLLIIVDDNGIGLEKSKELKTKHQRAHKSRGMTNTMERIELLNSLYSCHIEIDIQDKKGEDSGVIVTISLPLVYKNRDSHVA